MSAPVKFGGVEFVFAGETKLVIPPLSLNKFIHYQAKIKDLSANPDMALILEVVTSALQRNYPEMTADEVGDLLDMGNAKAAFQATMNANNAGPVPPGGDSGEAQAP